MFISVFCKSCEPMLCEPEIVQKLQLTFRLTPLTSAAKTLSRSVFSSQILQNAEMNIIVHWKFCRKFGSVLHLFTLAFQFS